jgi:hypothetical protein
MTEKLFCISENYKVITDNIQNALQKSGRMDKVRVMAVTKSVDTARVNAAISCGVDLLGENRAQEFLEKADGYCGCEVHFIGGLQTNKVKQIIDRVKMIQSVDSVKLAGEINRQAALRGLIMDVLVQVNFAGEQSKHGVTEEGFNDLVGEIRALANLRLRGVMVIPPFGDSVRYFGQTQRLFEEMKSGNPDTDTLSMGMSGDYYEAVLHGATVVRLGNALFGTGIRN